MIMNIIERIKETYEAAKLLPSIKSELAQLRKENAEIKELIKGIKTPDIDYEKLRSEMVKAIFEIE